MKEHCLGVREITTYLCFNENDPAERIREVRSLAQGHVTV